MSRLFAAIASGIVSICAFTAMSAQTPAGSLDSSGQMNLNGKRVPFHIRRLPVSSFPDLPELIATELTSRGCVIPQTYEAKRPENVVHASFERPGSSDWAVLCSVRGQVTLLVFFGSGSATTPIAVDSAAEIDRMQANDSSGRSGI